MSALHIRFGNPEALPISLLLSVIPSLPRHALDRLVEKAIDHMDEQDGDPDAEFDGDELDGTMGEDDFHHQNANWLGEPGCPVSDPAEDSHDRAEDQRYN